MKDQDIKKRVLSTLKSEREAVIALKDSLNDNFFDTIKLLRKKKGKIIVSGVGKSGFIAMKIAATLTSLGHGAYFLNPLDALHGDVGMVSDGDIIIAISFSGESKELVTLIKYLQTTFSVKVIAITGNKGSKLSKMSDGLVLIKIEEEGCPIGLAPMASTTAALVVGDLIASALTSPKIFQKKHFAKFHPSGSLGLSLVKIEDVMLVGKRMPIVKENEPMGGVLKEMSNKKRGIVGVKNGTEELIGVVTDGDLRRFLMKCRTIDGKVARDVMTKDPKTINKDESIKEALRYMEELKVANLFVVDSKNKLAGIIHMHNILEDYIV